MIRTSDDSLHFQIGELKQFTTSDGRKGQRLEVKLFDDSVPSFPLIWSVTVIYSFGKGIKFYYFCCFCAIFRLIDLWTTTAYLPVTANLL